MDASEQRDLHDATTRLADLTDVARLEMSRVLDHDQPRRRGCRVESCLDTINLDDTVDVAGHELAPDDFLVEVREGEGYAVASEAGYTVGVATAVTPELADEGIARELVRHIQDLRREADFELSDRITTWCAGGETVERVLAAHGDYVKAETLSVELLTEPPPGDVQQTSFTLDGVEVVVGVRRGDA